MDGEERKLIKKIIEELDEEKIYPKDIFPDLSKELLEAVNRYLKKNYGFPLDRLSAHIGRELLKGIKEKLKLRFLDENDATEELIETIKEKNG